MTETITLLVALAACVAAILAAVLAAVAAFRGRGPADPGIARTIEEKTDALRRDQLSQLTSQLQPIRDDLGRLGGEVASSKAEQRESLAKQQQALADQIGKRLEQVQRGLGEMQTLAQDVGGLKRALTNVKTRGVLGEAQLGALLAQYLAPGQYEANVRVKPRSNDVVEYAVRLPGADEGGQVWLPIDAKFPIEDYQKLADRLEANDAAGAEEAAKALEARLLGEARTIRDKYVSPPDTTDFAIMFLPFEGLFAEALRRPGLLERLQRDHKVTMVGPTTLTAFLNSLQMGFRTLAISRQSGEVLRLLGTVKAEFEKFGEALGAAQKKIEEAGKKLEAVSHRKDMMERRLSRIEAAPPAADEDGET